MSENIRVVRFLIPVHSNAFEEAVNKINSVFDKMMCKGPNPLYEEGEGYIFVWVTENSIECSFGKTLYDWFSYNAMLKGIEDVETLPLLYKILR